MKPMQSADPQHAEPEGADLPSKVRLEPRAPHVAAFHVVEDDGDDRRPAGEERADDGGSADDAGKQAQGVERVNQLCPAHEAARCDAAFVGPQLSDGLIHVLHSLPHYPTSQDRLESLMADLFALGLDTFGDVTASTDGTLRSQAQVLRDVVDEAVLADQVGIDAFGVGEHHRPDFAISAPEVMLAAIAGEPSASCSGRP